MHLFFQKSAWESNNFFLATVHHNTGCHFYLWAMPWEKGPLDFLLNPSFSGHARPLSKAACLFLWLKFPLSLLLLRANSIVSGENAQMCRLAWIFAVRMSYNGSFPMAWLLFLLKGNIHQTMNILKKKSLWCLAVWWKTKYENRLRNQRVIQLWISRKYYSGSCHFCELVMS